MCNADDRNYFPENKTQIQKWIILTSFLFIQVLAFAQVSENNNDTSEILQQVIVRAYENNRRLVDIPAAVSVISKTQLNRFSNISILPALNMNPGIRMEERSPGSYRLNIRGSSLRSPFGVRNVKVYYNGIPYTDPGGNTFLNQLGFYNVQNVEVLKGPGSSIYGAGTGGVILLGSDAPGWKPGIAIDLLAGSYNTRNINTNLQFGTSEFQNNISYQQLETNGYRDHTESERKVFTWDATAKISERGSLKTHLLYSDLYYETPGGLTASEYNANPKMARPRAGISPGSEEAFAAIRNRMFLAGFAYEFRFNDRWKSSTSLYGAFSELKNPTIRNYERRTEPHTGGRSLLEYKVERGTSLFSFQAGAEYQQGFATVRVAGNRAGNPDTIQTDDEIRNRMFFVFAQAIAELKGGWTITAGMSINQSNLEFTRLSDRPVSVFRKTYSNELAPRLAILKKINPSTSIYATVSKGFSPPTNAELLPSTSVISLELEAEEGVNYELGFRGSRASDRFYFDLNAFLFRLTNTIAQRRNAAGADYFVNAGSTSQLGFESYLSYDLVRNGAGLISLARVWSGYTWHHFEYKNFSKIGADTLALDGKRLPSIAPHVLTAGIDLNLKPGLYTNLTWYYSDPIPLNDLNTVYATSFNLVTARIGYRKKISENISSELFVAGDNLFDVKYSLGNDINAFGGRYFNAAAGRNFNAGVSLKLTW